MTSQFDDLFQRVDFSFNSSEPELESLEPFPDIHNLFSHYNGIYFSNSLGACSVEWSSSRMTLCAGVCHYRTGGGCIIKLSEPILKFRPSKDLKDTLLHEMIHAYFFLRNERDDDRSGHGTKFKAKMREINESKKPDYHRPPGGYRITVFHSMHAEVELYRRHVWRCVRCRREVRRAMNRPPQEADCFRRGGKGAVCFDPSCHWHVHLRTCGGTFEKVAEPPPPPKGARRPRSSKLNATTGAGASPKSLDAGAGRKTLNPDAPPELAEGKGDGGEPGGGAGGKRKATGEDVASNGKRTPPHSITPFTGKAFRVSDLPWSNVHGSRDSTAGVGSGGEAVKRTAARKEVNVAPAATAAGAAAADIVEVHVPSRTSTLEGQRLSVVDKGPGQQRLNPLKRPRLDVPKKTGGTATGGGASGLGATNAPMKGQRTVIDFVRSLSPPSFSSPSPSPISLFPPPPPPPTSSPSSVSQQHVSPVQMSSSNRGSTAPPLSGEGLKPFQAGLETFSTRMISSNNEASGSSPARTLIQGEKVTSGGNQRVQSASREIPPPHSKTLSEPPSGSHSETPSATPGSTSSLNPRQPWYAHSSKSPPPILDPQLHPPIARPPLPNRPPTSHRDSKSLTPLARPRPSPLLPPPSRETSAGSPHPPAPRPPPEVQPPRVPPSSSLPYNPPRHPGIPPPPVSATRWRPSGSSTRTIVLPPSSRPAAPPSAPYPVSAVTNSSSSSMPSFTSRTQARPTVRPQSAPASCLSAGAAAAGGPEGRNSGENKRARGCINGSSSHASNHVKSSDQNINDSRDDGTLAKIQPPPITSTRPSERQPGREEGLSPPVTSDERREADRCVEVMGRSVRPGGVRGSSKKSDSPSTAAPSSMAEPDAAVEEAEERRRRCREAALRRLGGDEGLLAGERCALPIGEGRPTQLTPNPSVRAGGSLPDTPFPVSCNRTVGCDNVGIVSSEVAANSRVYGSTATAPGGVAAARKRLSEDVEASSASKDSKDYGGRKGSINKNDAINIDDEDLRTQQRASPSTLRAGPRFSSSTPENERRLLPSIGRSFGAENANPTKKRINSWVPGSDGCNGEADVIDLLSSSDDDALV